MGVTTDAILFYGYCWDEVEDLFPDEPDGNWSDWEIILLKRQGEESPSKNMPDWSALPYQERKTRQEAWYDLHREEMSAWFARKDAVKREYGCETGCHCHSDHAMPYVYVSASRVRASRGDPQSLPLNALTVLSEWEGMLARFVAELGIKPPQEKPGWWLVSYWS